MTGSVRSGKDPDENETVRGTDSSSAHDEARDETVERLDDSEIVDGVDGADRDADGIGSASTGPVDGDTTDVETVDPTVADEADDDVDDDFDDLDDEDEDRRPAPGRTAFLATAGVAAGALLGVLFLVGAYIWPAFLGPGSPNAAADQTIAALQNQDAQGMSNVSCVRYDGVASAEFPQELLALIAGTTPAGPPQQTLDSEARAPVDLTVAAAPGQNETLPVDLLFGINGGEWCLNGLQPRQ